MLSVNSVNVWYDSNGSAASTFDSIIHCSSAVNIQDSRWRKKKIGENQCTQQSALWFLLVVLAIHDRSCFYNIYFIICKGESLYLYYKMCVLWIYLSRDIYIYSESNGPRIILGTKRDTAIVIISKNCLITSCHSSAVNFR